MAHVQIVLDAYKETEHQPGRQQLYAKIKRSSKYFHQNEHAKSDPLYGFPFKVTIAPLFGSYCVNGGPGGQYRLEDVNLFVVENGCELRIS